MILPKPIRVDKAAKQEPRIRPLFASPILKDDSAREPIATSYSAPGVLAEAAHKTGRAKADFELSQITKQEHDRLKALLQL